MKNVVEIDFFDEDMEMISLKDSPAQEKEDKPEDDANGEVQDVEMEPTQLLLKDWRYATSHPKDLILSDVSKGGNYSLQTSRYL